MSRKIIYMLTLALCICSSCKIKSNFHTFYPGIFSYKYTKTNYSEYLEVREDSTFMLISYGGFNTPSCSGFWKVNADTLYVRCTDETDPLAPFTSGYMSIRTRKIKIINSNKLKLPIANNVKRKYVVLKRIK